MKRLLAPALAMLVMSCGREVVREYELPKETFPLKSTAHAHMEQGSIEASGLHFKAPADWQVQPPAPMRKASFSVEGRNGARVDISVTSFPDQSGGLLANINRWRGQLGLEAVGALDLEPTLERGTLGGQDFVMVDLVSEPDKKQRIIGAILQAPGETWFFKMTGDDELTAAQKPAFVKFLESVRFGGSP